MTLTDLILRLNMYLQKFLTEYIKRTDLFIWRMISFYLTNNNNFLQDFICSTKGYKVTLFHKVQEPKQLNSKVFFNYIKLKKNHHSRYSFITCNI